MRRFNLTVSAILVLLIFAVGLSAVSFSGYVSDADNGEKIPYISVMIRGTSIGTYTNEEGYFIINNVPTGKSSVVRIILLTIISLLFISCLCFSAVVDTPSI